MKRVFIDCGAYTGDTIEFFKRAYPEGDTYEVYSFEPDKRVGEGIVSDRRLVWINDTYIPFYQGDLESSTCLKTKTTGNIDYNSPTLVQAVDFARWLETYRDYDRVVVKMDIEGAEYPVLLRLLSTKAISIIDELFVDFHSCKVGFGWREHLTLVSQLGEVGLFPKVMHDPWLQGYNDAEIPIVQRRRYLISNGHLPPETSP